MGQDALQLVERRRALIVGIVLGLAAPVGNALPLAFLHGCDPSKVSLLSNECAKAR